MLETLGPLLLLQSFFTFYSRAVSTGQIGRATHHISIVHGSVVRVLSQEVGDPLSQILSSPLVKREIGSPTPGECSNQWTKSCKVGTTISCSSLILNET